MTDAPKPKAKRRRRGGGGGGGGNQGQNGQGSQSNGNKGAQRTKRPDLWRPVPQLADPTPIASVPDPTALIRSLGDPPLQGQAAVAEHYLAAVVERAASMATALAASAGLLATPEVDPEN